VRGVPVIRIAWEAPGPHDQVALECSDQAHLDSEF
jgi:hypothetical protein